VIRKSDFSISLLAGVMAMMMTGSVSADSYGGQAAALTRCGAGARVQSMGGAVVSLAYDPATVLVNPSGATFAGKGTVTLGHSRLSEDRRINVIGFSRQIDKQAGFSFVWVNAGVDDVPGFDLDGNPTGTLDNSENSITTTFARRFGWFAAGVSARWYRFQLDTRSTTGWAFDFGVTVLPMRNLRLGAALRDVVGDVTWNTTTATGQLQRKESVPKSASLGASYKIDEIRTTIATDYEWVDREGQYLHTGASFAASRMLTLRGGYRWLPIGSSAREGTLTAGISLNFGLGAGGMIIDYAVMNERLGVVQSFGLRFKV
jgi:hypothetical protein